MQDMYETFVTLDAYARQHGPSVGAAIGAVVTATKGLSTVAKGWKAFRSRLELEGDRKEILQALFIGSGGHFLGFSGNNWLPADGQDAPPIAPLGYPHEQNAMFSITALLPEAPIEDGANLFRGTVHPDSRFICTGSPKSNESARRVLPFSRITDQGVLEFETDLPRSGVKYHFIEDISRGARPLEVISMMNKGVLKPKTQKRIWGGGISWQPDGYTHRHELTKDFLLVSRLPRKNVAGDVLILAGAHGAGTEAIRLLLDSRQIHIRQLRDLADQLAGKPYFQFVIEVTEVEHREDGTVPTRIRIQEEFVPPVVLDLSPWN